MYAFFISVASDMNVMRKAFVLASSLRVDFNYLDKSLITIWPHTNESNIKKMVFRNCKYYQTEYTDNNGTVIRICNLF